MVRSGQHLQTLLDVGEGCLRQNILHAWRSCLAAAALTSTLQWTERHRRLVQHVWQEWRQQCKLEEIGPFPYQDTTGDVGKGGCTLQEWISKKSLGNCFLCDNM